MSSLGTTAPWPMALHDPQNTGRSSFFGPTELTVAWDSVQTTSDLGILTTAPVIDSDGNLYVGNQGSGLYCIAPDGSLKWSLTLGGLPVDTTPAIGPDGTVYAAAAMVHAITSSGQLKWTFDIRDIIRNLYPELALQITQHQYGGALKLSTDGTTLYLVAVLQGMEWAPQPDFSGLFALHTSDGSYMWHRKFAYGCYSVPGVGHDGTVYVA